MTNEYGNRHTYFILRKYYIEKRNKRVEGDKAWETSTLRKILIIVLTYIFAVLLHVAVFPALSFIE